MPIGRRDFLRTTAAASLLGPLSRATAQARRPNVLLIYADDMGSLDLNCYGSSDLITPHLDKLAAGGLRFTQFYSAAPVCSPSRAAMLTGRYPQRAGVPGNVGGGEGVEGMPGEQVTIAEMLKAAGYATGHVGKWHLGSRPETLPNGQGFDYSIGHHGGCIDNYSHYFYWAGPNHHDLWQNGTEIHREGEYFPDLMAKEAGSFIEQHRAEPWFLYWAINIPHYPYQGRDAWRQKYAHLDMPRREYAAFVSTMDEIIGQVLDQLDALGLTNDTIVIFQSDNGHSTEERAFGGGGNAGPYRGAKFSLFEGGIRLPAMIRWPGRIPAGEDRGQLCTACDWLPTIADLTGVALPDRPIDGRSMRQVCRSAAAPTSHEVFHWQSGGTKDGPQWAVREGDWKLIGNPRDTSNKATLGPADKLFLVNLADDPGELTNLAAREPARVERMVGLHEGWLAGQK